MQAIEQMNSMHEEQVVPCAWAGSEGGRERCTRTGGERRSCTCSVMSAITLLQSWMHNALHDHHCGTTQIRTERASWAGGTCGSSYHTNADMAS